jgi:hypothetical protein
MRSLGKKLVDERGGSAVGPSGLDLHYVPVIAPSTPSSESCSDATAAELPSLDSD